MPLLPRLMLRQQCYLNWYILCGACPNNAVALRGVGKGADAVVKTDVGAKESVLLLLILPTPLQRQFASLSIRRQEVGFSCLQMQSSLPGPRLLMLQYWDCSSPRSPL